MSMREQLSDERKRLQKEGLLPDWFTTQGWSLFKQKYIVSGEEAFKGRAESIASTAAKHTDNPTLWYGIFYEMIWKGWLSCSTPILANMGTTRGYSVSCSGQYIGDSVDDFYLKLHEAAMLSKMGFGTSGYLGDIRPRGTPISGGGKATGVLPVFEDYVIMASKITQGGTRRGAWAGYIPIMHPDFDEVYKYVYDKPDEVNVGFTWYDSDTESMQRNEPALYERFKDLMKLRGVQGKGYLVFPDKANRLAPQMYKDHGLSVKSSNLCTEIFLHQDRDHTYTCVLASLNLSKYDEWKDTDTIFNATVFLDCVAQEFIVSARGKSGFEEAVRFTEKGRALGLGVMGLHTYMQKNMIAFESLQAQFFNQMFFKEMNEKSLAASKWMAQQWGEPEWCKGYGVRNTHRIAIAPTMSTSAIMGGSSQGIEPMLGNCFVQSTAGAEDFRINPVFLDLMKKRGKYTKKLCRDIADQYGSVQHLDWLTDEEKLVFKTAYEINQEVILRLASQRQRYIDQGQSLNLFFSAEEEEGYIAYIHRLAIEDPYILSLYYVRSQSGVSASKGCESCQ